MHQDNKWVYIKPSIFLAILLILITSTHAKSCYATLSQNQTITEISNYSFEKGIYNVLKYRQTPDSPFEIIQETEIPYLNISYTATVDGILRVTLTPTSGSIPYIELNTGWDTDGLNYIKAMKEQETSYIILTPPWVLSDYNSSSIAGGGTTLWELYNWPDVHGLINYTFISAEEISFQLVIHPSNPKQDESIDLYTISDAEITDIMWSITGPDLSWKNNTQVLELNDLLPGEYFVYVKGYDELGNIHSDQDVFTVVQRNDLEAYNIQFFSVSYTDTVNTNELVDISATIDYSLPNETNVKCILIDSSTNMMVSEKYYKITGTGSIYFNHQLTPTQEGVKPFSLRLYLEKESKWIEVPKTATTLTLNVTENSTSSMPGYPLELVLSGIILTIGLSRIKRISSNR